MSSAWMKAVLAQAVEPVRGERTEGRQTRVGVSAVAQKAVLMVIAWHHFSGDETVALSVRQIAKEASLHRTQVMRAIDALCDAGILSKARSGNTLRYRISCTEVVAQRDHQPVAQRDQSHSATSRIARPPEVAQRDHPKSHSATTEVAQRDHHIRDKRSGEFEGDTPPTPPGGGGEEQATLTDRREAELAHRSQAAGRALEQPPHLTGDEAADALAVTAWYERISPGGVLSPIQRDGLRRLCASHGPDEVVQAVQDIFAAGAGFPLPRTVKSRIGTNRSRRIEQQKAQARSTGSRATLPAAPGWEDKDPTRFHQRGDEPEPDPEPAGSWFRTQGLGG